MNHVIEISNQGELPVMYELPCYGNAVPPSRSSNVMDQIFRFADVTVDVGRRKITRGGEAVKLTPAEYNLLLYFLKNMELVIASCYNVVGFVPLRRVRSALARLASASVG
jgi:hypothetical protein